MVAAVMDLRSLPHDSRVSYRRCFPDLWFSIVQARRVSDAVVSLVVPGHTAGLEPGMRRSPHAFCAKGVSILHVKDVRE